MNDFLTTKLRTKFKLSADEATETRELLSGIAHVIEPLVRLDVVADDPDDNRVLECAVAGRADCIVSGDRHLLRLGAFEGTPILTVRQLMEAGGF